METFLFDSIIIGPVRSRRLGSSLGANLLAPNSKLCNFDCIYCECGWNGAAGKGGFNPADRVIEALEERLRQISETGDLPDVITFAGNGEPTMHPDFERIIDATVSLREQYAPRTRIAVLSNATMIDRPQVRAALGKVDRNILKLDSAIEHTVRTINRPNNRRPVQETIELMKAFGGELVVQTMLLRGRYNGEQIDNTTPEEVQAWLDAIRKIRPREVMLYTIDRNTPADELEKVPYEEMREIGDRVEALGLGIEVSVAW